MKIYTVEGSTGEYEDRRTWSVKAFKSKKKADELCYKLNKAADKRGDNKKIQEYLKEAGDPYASVDYGGTNYYVYDLELE